MNMKLRVGKAQRQRKVNMSVDKDVKFELSKIKQQRICNEIKFIDFYLRVLRSKS
jgi:hypothetical protein